MSLLWFDGFSGGAEIGNYAGPYLSRRYIYNSSDYWRSQLGPGGKNYAVGLATGENFITPKLTTDRTLYIGAAIKIQSAITTSIEFCTLYQTEADGSLTKGISLRRSSSSREIEVRRNGTTIWTTSTGGRFTLGSWHYIELKVYCDSTDGEVEIRTGGNSIFTAIGNTQASSSINYHDVCAIATPHNSSFLITDFYICDGASSINNNFLGPSRVLAVSPSSDGDETDWAPNSGSNHYDRVNQLPTLDTSSYTMSTSHGDKDLWNYENISNIGSSIHGVQVLTTVVSPDGATARLKTLAKLDTTETVDAGEVLCASWLTLPRIMETQPDGSVWSLSDLNNCQFGAEHAEV